MYLHYVFWSLQQTYEVHQAGTSISPLQVKKETIVKSEENVLLMVSRLVSGGVEAKPTGFFFTVTYWIKDDSASTSFHVPGDQQYYLFLWLVICPMTYRKFLTTECTY